MIEIKKRELIYLLIFLYVTIATTLINNNPPVNPGVLVVGVWPTVPTQLRYGAS